MMKIISGIGLVILTLLKWMSMIVLGALRLCFELTKVILLLFGLVARVFLAFVRIGTM